MYSCVFSLDQSQLQHIILSANQCSALTEMSTQESIYIIVNILVKQFAFSIGGVLEYRIVNLVSLSQVCIIIQKLNLSVSNLRVRYYNWQLLILIYLGSETCYQ